MIRIGHELAGLGVFAGRGDRQLPFRLQQLQRVARTRRAFFFEDGRGLRVRLARMDDDGKADVPRQPDLLTKDLALHVTRLREQIELQRKLCERLEGLAEHFRPAGTVSAEAFLQTIEVMTMIENLHRTHGLTSVVATHNLELAHRADRLLRLADGELTEALVPPVR